MGKTWGSVQVSSAVRGVTSLVSKFRGAFNPGRGRREEMMGMRPARLLCTSPYPSTFPRAAPVVKVMLAGEVKLGPRRPRTVAV